MSAKSNSTFHLGNVQTAEDIPAHIWRQALFEIRDAFPCVKEVGEVPISGGSVMVNGHPERAKWDPRFCNILRQFNGTPLSEATVC